MKKKVLGCTLAALMIASLAGCSKSDATVQYGLGLSSNGFYENITASDIVTLPDDYATIAIPEDKLAGIEEGMDDFLQYVKQSSKGGTVVTDRKSQVGDTVSIDYDGTINGESFQGGKGSDVSVELGAGTFIEQFENALVGREAGEQFDVTILFPEDYGTTTNSSGEEIDLSEKEAVFSVKINSIKEVELNDELVKEVFSAEEASLFTDGTQIDSVEKAKNYYRDNQKKAIVTSYIQEYLTENATVNKDSDAYKTIVNQQMEVEEQYVQYIADLHSYDTVEEFLVENGYENGYSQYLNEAVSSIESNVTNSLIIQSIAEHEGISVEDLDFAKYLGENLEATLDAYGEAFTAQMVLQEKVVQSLVEKAIS